MLSRYSKDDLVRYLYREMTAEEVVRMKQQLETDPVLRAELAALQQAKQVLPQVKFLPASDVIHRILQYSTKTALEAQL